MLLFLVLKKGSLYSQAYRLTVDITGIHVHLCACTFENVGHDVSCQVAGEYFWKHSGAVLTICAYVQRCIMWAAGHFFFSTVDLDSLSSRSAEVIILTLPSTHHRGRLRAQRAKQERQFQRRKKTLWKVSGGSLAPSCAHYGYFYK